MANYVFLSDFWSLYIEAPIKVDKKRKKQCIPVLRLK
jgi:hypothetical protein